MVSFRSLEQNPQARRKMLQFITLLRRGKKVVGKFSLGALYYRKGHCRKGASIHTLLSARQQVQWSQKGSLLEEITLYTGGGTMSYCTSAART